MEIDGPTATIIAASVALMLAIMGFIGVVNSRLGKLEAGQQALSEKVDTHHSENLRMHKETRAENLRMHEVTQAQNIRMHEEARAENHEVTQAQNLRMHEETRAENVRMYSEARAENIRMHDQSRAENVRMHEETRADIRRVLDALVTHSHDADGPVFFRIPPGTDPEN
jgi:hypothetical protein